MTVKLLLPFHVWFSPRRSKALAQLKIPIDRIERLEVSTEILNTQICEYIAKCVYLTVLKIKIKIYHELFLEEAWIDLTELQLLTHLNISVITRCHQQDYANMVMHAIRPYFKECKNLKTINVSYCNEFRQVPDELSFDAIRKQINLKIWSFTYLILRKKVYFTLEKR